MPGLEAAPLFSALFVTWIATAQAIYVAVFGYETAAGIPDFRAARADHDAGAGG